MDTVYIMTYMALGGMDVGWGRSLAYCICVPMHSTYIGDGGGTFRSETQIDESDTMKIINTSL